MGRPLLKLLSGSVSPAVLGSGGDLQKQKGRLSSKKTQISFYPCAFVPDFISAFLCFQRRQWHPTPVLLPGKSHGRRSLVGCSPWGLKESDTTERLHLHFSLSCIGEGNGNLPQYSCLENPRDGGAWWAPICGVAQSLTWLKRLSSSSSLCFVSFFLSARDKSSSILLICSNNALLFSFYLQYIVFYLVNLTLIHVCSFQWFFFSVTFSCIHIYFYFSCLIIKSVYCYTFF